MPYATSRGRYFIPQSDDLGRLDGQVVEVDHAEDDALAGQRCDHRRVDARLRRLDRDLVAGDGVELGQEGVLGGSAVDDRGVAEADVHSCCALDPVERPLERRDAVVPGLLRPRLHVRLVDLDDIRPRGEQVGDLVVDGAGIDQRQLALVVVEVVLRLL